MSFNDLIKSMLCPTSVQSAKLVNKYISIMNKARKNIDEGLHVSNLTFPPHVEFYNFPDVTLDDSFVSCSSSSTLSSDSFSEIETD